MIFDGCTGMTFLFFRREDGAISRYTRDTHFAMKTLLILVVALANVIRIKGYYGKSLDTSTHTRTLTHIFNIYNSK